MSSINDQYRLSRNVVRILLVEDSDADAFLLGESARELAYDLQVQRFSTVDEFMRNADRVMEGNPHGALLDLNLPGGSGLDVLRKIRASESARHLPVVVMTSSTSMRDREAVEKLGVQGYLVKPSRYNQFVAAVEIALRLILGENQPLRRDSAAG